jgi:hypothetical protein
MAKAGERNRTNRASTSAEPAMAAKILSRSRISGQLYFFFFFHKHRLFAWLALQ